MKPMAAITVKTEPLLGECWNLENGMEFGEITCFGCETKTGVVLWLFFKIGLCSVISFKRSRRELSIDKAEHSSMLKIDQNTHYPPF